MKVINTVLFIILFASTGYSQLAKEDFEETWPPSGWSVYNFAGPQQQWSHGSVTTGQSAHSLVHTAYMQRENVVDGTYTEDFLVTKPFIVPATPQISFWNYTTIAGNQGNKYRIMLLPVNADPAITSSYILLKEYTETELTPSAQSWTFKVLSHSELTARIGQQVRIAFVMMGDFGDRWLLDDVQVATQCLNPVSLNAANLTTTSAELSWLNMDGATHWEIEIMNSLEAPTGIGTMITENPYIATLTRNGAPLLEGNIYKFYIRSLCENNVSGAASEWVGPFTFKILTKGETCAESILIPPGLPYVRTNQNFIGSNLYGGSPGSGCGSGNINFLDGSYTVYQYTATTDTTLNISIDPLKNETGLFIYDNCSNIGLNCLTGTASISPLTKRIMNFSVVNGTTYYILVATKDISNNYTISVTENSCASEIAASFYIDSDCYSGSSFNAVANVTSLGNAVSIKATAYDSSNNPSAAQIIAAPSQIVFPSYASTEIVKIVLESLQNPNCTLISPSLSKDLCPPINDNCSNAVSLIPNTIGNGSSTPATLGGATPSTEPSTCIGSEDDDVWFQFTAVESRHLVYITNINGFDINIDMAIYSGNCDNLIQIACSDSNSITLTGLVVGQTYKIRVYSKGSQPTQTSFNVATTAFAPNCTDDNPQSNVVKNRVIELINHLIDAHEDIINYENQQPGSQGYFCTELAALAPYLTDVNPFIHHFVLNSEGLSFSFSDHGPGVSNADIFIPFNSVQYLENINFFSYTSPQNTSDVHITYIDGVSVNRDKVAHFSHINFCPEDPCIPVTGKILINGAMDCMQVNNVNGFVFQTDNTNIDIQSWAVYKVENNLTGLVQVSNLTSPALSFTEIGYYIVKVTVTTPDNCSTTIQKSFEVLESCNLCTETNVQSGNIKQLYINLVNYLLANYSTLQGSPAFNCPALAALSPYISDSNPLIHNLNYNNGKLSFSFSDQNEYDVILQNNGPINDISLLTYSSASMQGTYLTNYQNGTINSDNVIQHINFCPDKPCPDIEGKITFDTGLSCVSLTETPIFRFQTSTLNITSYAWTFFNGNNPINLTPITTSHSSINFSAPGDYSVELEIIYNDRCSSRYTKFFTVDQECASCTETGNQAAIVKNLYIDLANHLITIFSNNGSLPSNPYVCPEIQALAPYISDNNAKIWNANYNDSTNSLTFSFSNHGSDYDVYIGSQDIIADINIVPFTSPLNFIDLKTFNQDGTVSSEHRIRHIEFCPPDCVSIPGTIVLKNGQSCIPLHTPRIFTLQGITSNVSKFEWFFYKGNIQTEISTAEEPEITYHTPGEYLVKLVVTDNSGCTTTFYKSIVVSMHCEACTERNVTTGTVKLFFKILLNKLLNAYEQGLGISNANIELELAMLAPYISDSNPGIYNINYINQTLSFSFSDQHSDPDVVINNYGDVVDINILNFTTSITGTDVKITYSDGSQSTMLVRHINFCPVEPEPEPCTSHVSFIIDESGSISEFEADNIKKQLLSFVQQQVNSNMIVSFVGMSDSDENLRTDHIYGKITSVIDSYGNETGTKLLFENWVNNYKAGYNIPHSGVSADSDYWLSGLHYAYHQEIKPELMIMITDGSQSERVQDLKNIISEITSDPESHLFIYGLKDGNYVDENNSQINANYPNNLPPATDDTPRLMKSVKYLMQLGPTEFPSAGNVDLLNVVYYEDNNNFDYLYTEPYYFSNQLTYSRVGCGGSIGEVCVVCETFQPSPKKAYWVSAWVKEERNIQVKNYTKGVLKIVFEDINENMIETLTFSPYGDIIDGWQRIGSEFTVPPATSFIEIMLLNLSEDIPVYYDDIRVHPINGSMKSFVYDPQTFRLMAEHDDNNYSTFYEYDEEGGLVRIKKETAKGVKTIQESRSGGVIKLNPGE